jgi:hypothetical protein
VRAARQHLGSHQQHDGLQIHAAVGPLRQAHLPVDVAEQADRGAEEPVVVPEPFQADTLVVP